MINYPSSDKNALLQAQINDLYTKLDAANSKITSLQSDVTLLQAQITNHENRIRLLESGGVFPGAFIGADVHLRDQMNHCVPALVIRDPGMADHESTISVVHLEANRETRITKWRAVYDIRQEIGADPPMTAWHIPENRLTP